MDPGLETQQTRIIKYDIMNRMCLDLGGLSRMCILLLLQKFAVAYIKKKHYFTVQTMSTLTMMSLGIFVIYFVYHLCD